MSQKFDDILREGMEKSLLELGYKDLSSANTLQRGRALTRFYLTEIGTIQHKIFEDDIELYLADGKSDLGVDFIYQKESGDWLIIQSKYKGQNNNQIVSDEIAGFFDTYSKIIDPIYVGRHAKGMLKDILEDLTPDDAITFLFVTNGRLSTRIEEDFERLKKAKENINDKVTYEFLGLTELKRDHQAILSEIESIAGKVRINVEKVYDSFIEKQRASYIDLSSVIDKEDKYKSILCTIKGTTLKLLWTSHKSKLFNYNIRGFLGENAINKKMRETIDEEPDKFYFYNNGISAICTDISAILNDGNIVGFDCENFSVINGAQTTTTIGKYKNDSKLKDVRVLLKITKAEDYKKEKGLNKKIITFNNSQTIIKVSDFRSNDDIQIFLEKKLPEYSYKGIVPHKKVQYQRKRTKINKSSQCLYISIESLARALYVFDNDPILIFKGTRYLFDIDSDNNGKYWKVFGDDGNEVGVYDLKRMEKITGIYFLWHHVESLIKAQAKKIKEDQNETIRYQALLAKWHFLWAYGFVINNFYKSERENLFRKIATGKLFEGNGSTFIDKWFPKIHGLISKCIKKNYNSSLSTKADDTKSFNFKNWLRSNSEFEQLKLEFEFIEPDYFALN